MIPQDTWNRLATPAIRTKGNTPILLDEDDHARFIEEGKVAIYCARCRDGEVAGPRRFLGQLPAGVALFSAQMERADGLRFLFVPAAGTVLREVPLDALLAESKRTPLPLDQLLDRWIDFICQEVEGVEAPKLSRKLEERGELDLEEGEVVATAHEEVAWIKLIEGKLNVFGAPNLLLEPGQAYLPLTGRFWARSEGSARVAVRRSGDLGEARQIRDGLWRLHVLVLSLLGGQENRAAEREADRLQERERTQHKRTQEAVVSLAAVLDPRSARKLQEAGAEEDSLLLAMRAVGEQQGLKIKAPAASESSGRPIDPIEAIARSSQVRTRRVSLTGKWWKTDSGPLLGFTTDGQRPVALLRKRSGYVMFDPGEGKTRRVGGRVARSLLGEGVVIYRHLPTGKLTLLDLARFGLHGRGHDLGVMLAIGGFVTLLGMLVPLATAKIMDQAIPDADGQLLLEIGAGLLAVTFGQVIFRLAQGLYLLRVQVASEAETQAAVWDRLLRLKPAFFRRFSSGDLQSRVMAVDAIGNRLSGTTLTSVFSGVMAFLNLGLLYYFSASLSMIAVAIGVLLSVVTISVSYFIRRNTKDLLEIQGHRYGLEIQLINGVGKLRVGGAGDRAFNHWMKKYSQQMGLLARNFRLQDGMTLFNQMVPTIGLILLFFFAFDLIDPSSGERTMSLGIFLAFSSAYGAFLTGLTSLTGTLVQLMDIVVKARRVQPILEEEPEINEDKADPGRLTGHLEVRDASFRYDTDGPEILKDVTLRAEPGEFIAVVGPSGSGKSTLMRLLLGFEAPHSGSVSFDHQDLSSVDVLAVRRQLGVVLQGGSLDAGTVFENISSGNIISLDQAWAAAEDAGLADDIRKMPMGMHTIISVGGGNVSGGQRQRMLIARALVQSPKLLLFDEATSALDNRTQAIVSESLERLRVTRIVIAHRLSTIRNADRIYVIEAGKVVQDGRFEDLIAQRGGLFARMMERQMA